MEGQILVVDDDASIRNIVYSILAAAGYSVAVAASAADALAAADGHAFDLLLSDIIMPGGDGIQLAHSLRQRQPLLRVLLMTGYDNELLEIEPEWTLIAKPFRPEELKAKVSEVLSSTVDPQ